MTDGIDIGAIDRRARTAGYGDGLLELFAAVVLLTLALAWASNPGVVGILAAVVAIYGWKVVERIKERVTYPRVGYFQERADDAKQTSMGMLLFIGGALLVMVVVVLFSGGLDNVTEWRRAAPLVSGLIYAGGFWFAGQRSGMLRYRLVAAWSFLSGVLLWWFGTGETYQAVAIHMWGLAIPLAVVGTWSLVRFMRTHPVLDVQDDE